MLRPAVEVLERYAGIVVAEKVRQKENVLLEKGQQVPDAPVQITS